MTQIDANALLRQLGGTPRAAATQRLIAPVEQSIDGLSFTDLLAKARDGELTSNRPITIDSKLGLTLDDETLARLSLAADKAEAAGIRNAVVLTDDGAFILDIASRTITGEAALSEPIADIDGLINLSSKLAQPQADPVLPFPSSFINPHAQAMEDE